MGHVTTNLRLNVWDQGDDKYDHRELANNWAQIDTHDHDQAAGRGKQVPTGGLKDGAVTQPKLATDAVDHVNIRDDAVRTRHYQDGSVTNPALGDEAVDTRVIKDRSVTPAKLAEDLIPLGTVIPWWRPNTGVPVPPGWRVANGDTVQPEDHDFPGGGIITLPDLRNRFILGADVSNTGTESGDTPAIGATGGNNTQNTSHTHTIPGHSHPLSSHDHSVPQHSHGISMGGMHFHKFLNDSPDPVNGVPGDWRHMKQREVGVVQAADISKREASWTPGLNHAGNRDSTGNTVLNVMSGLAYYPELEGVQPQPRVTYTGDESMLKTEHDHGGSTGSGPSDLRTGQTGGTTLNSASLTTGAASGGSSDTRPRFAGLLYLIKIKDIF